MRETYREFCAANPGIPVFLTDWWLDLVCGEGNWDFVSYEEGDQIKAVWPYYFINGNYSQRVVKMPRLTPFSGPWIKYPVNQKYCSLLSYEKEVINKLIDKLPATDFFQQNINLSIRNKLPFYWRGFDQSLSYTYKLTDLSKTVNVFSGFKESTRSDIRKAEKYLKVVESDNIGLFYKINSLTFDRKNKKIPYSFSFIERLDKECRKQCCRSILMAEDGNSNYHAAIYLIWDRDCTYYLMGGADPEFRNSGAMSLLIWAGINQAAQRKQSFDFEGSMIEPIEHFFRSFGGEQNHYLQITKRSRKGKFIKLLSEVKKLVFGNA